MLLMRITVLGYGLGAMALLELRPPRCRRVRGGHGCIPLTPLAATHPTAPRAAMHRCTRAPRVARRAGAAQVIVTRVRVKSSPSLSLFPSGRARQRGAGVGGERGGA